MAGPGIRYWEFARILSRHFQVELLLPPLLKQSTPPQSPFPAAIHVCVDGEALRRRAAAADVIITRGVILTAYPFLAELNKPIVLDMYSPILLEGLQQAAEASELARRTTFERNLQMLRTQLSAADFILCASEKQRDYWLGLLSALGRVNPQTHGQDHTLRRLIDVAPFGLPADPPPTAQPVLKGIVEGIHPQDKVILWGGGIWNWLDAETLIRAMARIRPQRPDVKLFFMGTRRPNSDIVSSDAVERAMALSAAHGLTNTAVFFNDWVPYDQRHSYLLEADVGVSLHLDHVETRFSFRTRLLDYIWTGLPTVATGGDVMGEAMAAHGVATLVPPQDVDRLVDALLELLDRPDTRAEMAPRFRALAAQYTWEQAAQPLIDFCHNPAFAADRPFRNQYQMQQSAGGPAALLRKSWQAVRLGGLSGFLAEVRAYWRWQQRR